MAVTGRIGESARVFMASVVLILVTCVLVTIAHNHGHSHEEPREPPSFKYSKNANQPDSHAHNHGHSHDHGHAHNHGHSHDHGHAHSHGHSHDHGHAHDHGHGHDRSHGHAHDHGHAHSHGHTHQHPDDVWKQPQKPKVRETGVMLWLQALGATFLISVSPVVILFFIPLENTSENQPLLKVLLSFASGGLLGDAFLHLIPHAVSPHSHGGDHTHSHSHDHAHGHSHDMSVGLWVLAGIVAFLIVEKFVRYVKGGHAHSHSHEVLKVVEKEEINEGKKDKIKDQQKKKDDMEATDGKEKKTDDGEAKEGKEKKKDDNETKEDSLTAGNQKEEEIKVAGYLNLAADFAHNFTDGLAIGASFLVGRNLGIITTITIFLHEIPHEIGDFAILVQSGCSKKKAMMLQFSTAIGAMLGTISSLLAEGIGDAATAWILPFTAGGFIYIATVSVIPELLEDTKLGQSIKEIIALFIGIYMMVLIGQYE